MKYVIIGNSAAAIGGAEGIRSVDQKGEITLISKESEFIYSRPLISYYLKGEVKKEDMAYRGADFYEKNQVKAILGKAAVAVDSNKKTVKLGDDTVIPYDRLLVATGATPLMPPIPGLGKVKEKYTFQSMADVLALEKVLSPERDVLILGGGLIGLKCAEGIGEKAKSVTVIDRFDHVLPSILDNEGAAMMQKRGEAHGVSFFLGENAVKAEDHKMICESGKEVYFDILVVAAGVKPEISLLKSAGAKINHGIVVDEKNATSLPDIYAAGDCAEGTDVVDGVKKILALLPNAYLGGKNAGINMAGGSHVYETAMAVNALKLWDDHLITAGIRVGETYVVQEDGAYKKLYYSIDEGYLNGFIMIGDVDRAGIYTSLIRERTPLKEIDFELIKENPQYRAFSRQVRNDKLGGRT
ncbi:MAG TPA: FAD-dependent oxidoreductase [Clostridiales bacterium]|nr:FAD-dependent oxidoreductase [Clostridiales bacterium]